jgi:hypothetical protein
VSGAWNISRIDILTVEENSFADNHAHANRILLLCAGMTLRRRASDAGLTPF